MSDGTPPEPAPASERVGVRRHPERGRYDTATVHAILDEGFVAHVGLATEDGPVVIPMAHARWDDRLVLHGSPASRLLRGARGVEVCATVTLLDGLVLARSAFHHSMNYRSVVVRGVATAVEDLDERRAALHALIEHLSTGRTDAVRAPSEKELRATSVLVLPLAECSVKVRTGDPVDEPEDLDLPIWAGVVPLALRAEPPVDATDLRTALEVPDHVRCLVSRAPLAH